MSIDTPAEGQKFQKHVVLDEMIEKDKPVVTSSADKPPDGRLLYGTVAVAKWDKFTQSREEYAR